MAPVSKPGVDAKLQKAAAAGDAAAVEQLLRAGAFVNATDGDGNSALHNAANEGHVAVVRLLLRAGATLELRNESLKTPLFESCSGGQAAVALLLLEAGANVNAGDAFGETPLFAAATEGEVDVVRVLLAQPGVLVDAVNDEGRTPLHDAAAYGHADVVDLLLDAGANPHVRSHDNKTPFDLTKDPRVAARLMVAAEQTASPEVPPQQVPRTSRGSVEPQERGNVAPPKPPPKRAPSPPKPPPKPAAAAPKPPPKPEPAREAPRQQPPPPPPPRADRAPPIAAAPAKASAASAHAEAFERVMRAEIDALTRAIDDLHTTPEAQRTAARKLRKRFHPDASRDIISLLPARADMYQRLSQHANAKTEGFLAGTD